MRCPAEFCWACWACWGFLFLFLALTACKPGLAAIHESKCAQVITSYSFSFSLLRKKARKRIAGTLTMRALFNLWAFGRCPLRISEKASCRYPRSTCYCKSSWLVEKLSRCEAAQSRCPCATRCSGIFCKKAGPRKSCSNFAPTFSDRFLFCFLFCFVLFCCGPLFAWCAWLGFCFTRFDSEM
jgi:hypothetical protein